MRIIDPGHVYELAALDGGAPQALTFVKRDGDEYPGNVGHHGGVIIQEVLRALIDRCGYVNEQIQCEDTRAALNAMKLACFLLERRAAVRHGRRTPVLDEAVYGETHEACGHVGCTGGCERGTVQP